MYLKIQVQGVSAQKFLRCNRYPYAVETLSTQTPYTLLNVLYQMYFSKVKYI